MANTLQDMIRPQSRFDREPNEDTQAAVNRLTHELAARELNTRFLDALERGEIDGDILVIDEQGNEVKNALPHTTIFEL